MNRQTIHQTAEAVLKKCEVELPPVPVLEILETEGYSITPSHFDDYSSQVGGYLDPAKKILFIDQTDSPAQQAEIMGYGLGLIQLFESEIQQEPDLRVCYRQPDQATSHHQESRWAYDFAAALLIPQRSLSYYQNKLFVTASNLATIFGVTSAMIEHRLTMEIS